ncbi:Rhomboid-like protease 4 [Babesia sp. Xinjiang]|uniref:Rhomboid-like protease 4 n=1 Tax=Babesia sp. Xinjiang TaxID=462227 RepID=UPI000A23F203|nr:Rhomboid-like protease 4 [Babesia sp. Xinjiang]ORM41739.1 Rhomboid-like protease 4 [Babesia sp. Xinjiang]
MAAEDSNDKNGSDEGSGRASKGSFVKNTVKRGFLGSTKRSSDADRATSKNVVKPKTDDVKPGADVTNDKKDDVKANKEVAGPSKDKDVPAKDTVDTAEKSVSSKAKTEPRPTSVDTKATRNARAKFLAEKYEKIIAARHTVEASANRALERVSQAVPRTLPVAAENASRGTKSASPVVEFPAPSPRLQTQSTRSKIHTLSETLATDAAATSSGRSAPVQVIISDSSSQSTQDAAPRRRNVNVFGMPRGSCVIRTEAKATLFPGKLIWTFSSTLLMTVLFIYQLFINRTTFNGRCVGEVDYSTAEGSKPFVSPLGFVACENNLKTTVAQRGLLGAAASDDGYPETIVKEGRKGYSKASSDGPNFRIGIIVGSQSANHIRHYGESYRLWTSIFLHGGIWHILFNGLLNLQLLYIVEPDWGLLRTVAVYMLGGYGANLVHSSMSPCYPSWGASGSLFAMFGALIPYCVEHWYELRAPGVLTFLSFMFLSFEIIMPAKNASSHAHLGGYMFGFCLGFLTLKSTLLFDRGALYHRFVLYTFAPWLPDETLEKYQAAVRKATQAEEIARIKYEQEAKNRANRLRAVKRFFRIYPFGPYRMRLRDILIRLLFLCITIGLFTYFYVATFNESVYSKLSRESTRFFSSGCFCGYLKKAATNETIKKQIGNLAGKFHCFQTEGGRNSYCD